MDHVELCRVLLFTYDVEVFFRPLDAAIQSTPARFAEIASAFRENVRSVLSAVGLPVLLVRTARGSIPALGDVPLERIVEEIVTADLLEPAAELLQQGTVLTWTAIEVLATDIFIELLNTNPDLSPELMQNEKTNKRFGLKNVPLETISSFGYDLSSKMGLVFAQRQTLDTAQVMRDVLDVLFPESDDLRTLLQKDRFWILNYRRNLIVHRRGMVDAAYLASTSENLPLGSRLPITLADIVGDAELVRGIGIEILSALPGRLKIVPPVP